MTTREREKLASENDLRGFPRNAAVFRVLDRATKIVADSERGDSARL